MMLVIKRFRERKKVLREREKAGKCVLRVDYRMVVREIEDVLLEEMEFGWLFEQDIDDDKEEDKEDEDGGEV
ncbi:hypothetical protein Tco_0018938 [Tanacetum coccineum]